jgi:hypothetical protein
MLLDAPFDHLEPTDVCVLAAQPSIRRRVADKTALR